MRRSRAGSRNFRESEERTMDFFSKAQAGGGGDVRASGRRWRREWGSFSARGWAGLPRRWRMRWRFRMRRFRIFRSRPWRGTWASWCWGRLAGAGGGDAGAGACVRRLRDGAGDVSRRGCWGCWGADADCDKCGGRDSRRHSAGVAGGDLGPHQPDGDERGAGAE